MSVKPPNLRLMFLSSLLCSSKRSEAIRQEEKMRITFWRIYATRGAVMVLATLCTSRRETKRLETCSAHLRRTIISQPRDCAVDCCEVVGLLRKWQTPTNQRRVPNTQRTTALAHAALTGSRRTLPGLCGGCCGVETTRTHPKELALLNCTSGGAGRHGEQENKLTHLSFNSAHIVITGTSRITEFVAMETHLLHPQRLCSGQGRNLAGRLAPYPGRLMGPDDGRERCLSGSLDGDTGFIRGLRKPLASVRCRRATRRPPSLADTAHAAGQNSAAQREADTTSEITAAERFWWHGVVKARRTQLTLRSRVGRAQQHTQQRSSFNHSDVQ